MIIIIVLRHTHANDLIIDGNGYTSKHIGAVIIIITILIMIEIIRRWNYVVV